MSATSPLVPAPGSRSLVDRIKSILVEPRKEWMVIDAEAATVGSIYRYAFIVAAIPPVCRAIRLTTIGYVHLSAGWALRLAIGSYIGALVAVYVLALIIDALAPTFGGTKGQIAALKVSAYSATAAWVFGIFTLIPFLGILALVGAIYSLYLLYLGLPILMKVPSDKAVSYSIAVIVAAIVVFMVIGAIVGRFVGLGALYSGYGGYSN